MNDFTTPSVRAVVSTDRRLRIDASFTPGSPVSRRELFAGRTHALQQLLELATQPGRHAVVFGEGSTGKSSLATIVPAFADGPVGFVRVASGPGDTFTSLWRRVAEAVRTSLRRAERGLSSSPFPADVPTTLGREGAVTVPEAAALLSRAAAGAPAWIVFDDFDRVTDEPTRVMMRTLAESTESAAAGVTLVFCGRAQSGDELLRASASLVPVRVGRFTPEESLECVLRGLRQCELTAEDVVVERIAALGNGIPGSVHALARATALEAVAAGAAHLGLGHLDSALGAVLAASDAAVAAAYDQATVRARRGIYPEILLACALAPRDESGRFNVADVCDAVTRIVHREVRGLTNQISALTEDGRGTVLEKHGIAKAARYRFLDPRLEPYILMKGLEEGWATHDTAAWLPGLSGAEARGKAA